MDTSYSIRLGIEDQAAVEKAFAAIGEAGKTALATVQGAAGSASSSLGAVSNGASEIAHGFNVVSASATGLAAVLGTAGLPMVAAKALALAEATENVATALSTAGGVAGIASEALGLLTESQQEQAAAAQSATDDIAALAEAQAGLADAQDEQAAAAQSATDDIQAMAAAQGELEEKSGTSLTTVLAWAAGIAAAAGVVYLAYKTVETGVDLAGDAISALADIARAEALRRLDEQSIEAFRHQEDLARELGVSASLQRQAELAEQPNWFEKIVDSIDEAISRSEEFKLKQALALEPAASGWAEYWPIPVSRISSPCGIGWSRAPATTPR